MAVEVTMRAATEADAVYLAANLRSAEVDEIEAAVGREPLPVLLDALRDGAESWTVCFDGTAAAMWGVVPQPGFPSIGVGWLLTTAAVERHAKAFWQTCLALLPAILERWPVLINAIDARHAKAIRWAKRLGLQLEQPAPFGAAGLPFCAFHVTKGDLCAHQSR